MSDPRDRIVQAASEWNEARLAATTGAASRYGPTPAESARLAKTERALNDAVNALLPADMTSGDGDTRPTIEVVLKRPNNDEKLTTIEVWFDDQDEAERAYDAIETLLGDMGKIGTLSMTSGDGWRDIEEAPADTPVWLYCPFREPITNPERIEYGVAHTSTGSHHAWATLWRPAIKPLPPTPKPEGE